METVTPDSVDGVSATLRDAAAAGRTVVARGGGTALHWGGTVRPDLVVDLRRLDRVVDHAAGDLVVTVQAGMPLAALAEVLAGTGQRLVVEVPGYDDGTDRAGATVGGALAVDLAGPRALRYGRPRDLLLGVTMVRADGVVASSGGRVVKNVAGYDLGKLLCGAYGTLGVTVTATLRLHPLPATTGYLTATAPEPAAAYRAAASLLDSQLEPAALELDAPPGRPVTLVALFEGTDDGVAARVAATGDLLEAAGDLLGAAGDPSGAAAAGSRPGGDADAAPPAWFGRWPGGPDGTLVELSFPPSALPGALDAVAGAADAAGLAVPARGSPGLGVLRLGVPADAEPPAVAGFLSRVREAMAGAGGFAVVRHAPEPVRAKVDLWGPVDPGALALMRRVKDQFDPDHRLAPGRLPPC